MTKLEINIKKKEITNKTNELKGAYLATNTNEDDRIIFFRGYNSTNVTVLNALYNGVFHMQEKQSAHMYTNLKKIKKITIEVELE